MERMTGAGLDGMLATALAAPATPQTLAARVMAAVARAGAPDVAAQRQRLLEEHARAVVQLRWRTGREGAQALVLAGCVSLPVRLGVAAVWLRLGGLVGTAGPLAAGLLAMAAAGGAAWLVGRPAAAVVTEKSRFAATAAAGDRGRPG